MELEKRAWSLDWNSMVREGPSTFRWLGKEDVSKPGMEVTPPPSCRCHTRPSEPGCHAPRLTTVWLTVRTERHPASGESCVSMCGFQHSLKRWAVESALDLCPHPWETEHTRMHTCMCARTYTHIHTEVVNVTRGELMKGHPDRVIVKGYGKGPKEPRRGQRVLPAWACWDLSIQGRLWLGL